MYNKKFRAYSLIIEMNDTRVYIRASSKTRNGLVYTCLILSSNPHKRTLVYKENLPQLEEASHECQMAILASAYILQTVVNIHFLTSVH